MKSQTINVVEKWINEKESIKAPQLKFLLIKPVNKGNRVS